MTENPGGHEQQWLPPASDTPIDPPATAGRRGRGRASAIALGVVGGMAAGVAIAWGVSASAATTSSATTTAYSATQNAASSSSSTGSPAMPGMPGDHDGDHRMPPGMPPGGCHAPGTAGTVTAVGTDSVTIKTASGTKTYSVTSASDIDKNGDATLSDLKTGDAVHFDTETVNGKTVIDHLHAGNEALDRPSGMH